jgi:hypothetical protein
VSPFTSWATAATNIQAAVDVAAAGETVWVGSGTYATGSRSCGGWNNRVVVTNAITVRSVNGPAATRIVGTDSTDMTGVYLAPNAWLIGVTVTNFQSWSVNVGGVYGGSLSNCVIAGNLGFTAGGASTSTLYQCTLSGNEGAAGGGGAIYSTLYNCVLEKNASDYAAATLCTLYNCTLVDNTGDAGSVAYSTAYNTILAGNSNGDSGSSDSAVYYCTYWLPTRFMWGEWEPEEGTNPLFVDYTNGNYRLQANSPCINAGTNLAWTAAAADFDGERRVYPTAGRVDIGAFEYKGDGEAVHKSDSVVTAASAFALGTNGQFMIRGGTQLVFVAGTVTNVLDSNIRSP